MIAAHQTEANLAGIVPASSPQAAGVAALVADPRLLTAGAWLAGYFRAHPDGAVGPGLDRRGVQDPLSDVPIPDWPLPPESAETASALRRFAVAGLLSACPDGTYRLCRSAEPLLQAFPLYVHRTAEDFVGRFPRLRECVEGHGVLEAGCGVGAYAAMFRDLGAASVIALEYASDRLGTAAALCAAEPRGVRLVRGSVEELPLRDGSVDFIFSRVVLPYVHHGRTLAEFARVLSQDGRVMLVLHARGFYAWQLRRAGLSPRRAGEIARALLGLAGGASQSLLGWEPRWRLRGRAFHLAYETRGSLGRLAARCGLRLDEWHDDRHKPVAWLSKGRD